ncbi:MAG: hypothetical protein EKK47_10235 [Burkholderiales bacterium]|nr:MAG: hypothetical protein EKK47_10235 [Burkholderiales bacterium]
MFGSLPKVDVVYATDFPTVGMLNIRDSFNRFLKHPPALQFTDLDENDIIARCRLLRNLDSMLARRMLRAMQGTIEEIIDGSHHMVFGQMVDDYITHLMALVAQKRGIRYFGLCGSYFSGCTHVTVGSDGTPAIVRAVSRDEAQKRLLKISTANFRQNYLQPTTHDFFGHAKRVLRYHAKLIAFPLLKFYRRDPLNYHYMVQPFVGQPKSLTNFIDNRPFHSDWQMQIEKSQDPLVYIPLGYTPEATTDYWIKDTSWIDYEKKIIELATFLSKDFKVVIKEHVHMLGIRDKRFYRELLNIENVISVPPPVNSNHLLQTYQPTLLIGGGSAGVEATIRGISIVSYCASSYWAKSSGALQITEDLYQNLPMVLNNARPAKVDHVNFLSDCLVTTFSFDYLQGSPLDAANESEVMGFIDLEYQRLTA